MVAIDRFSFLAKCYFKFACNCWECWLHASRTDCQKSQEAGQKLASSRAYTAATLVRLLIALDVAALGVEKYCVSGSVGRSVRRTWVKGHLASWGADYWGLHRSKRLVFKIKLWLHLILPNFHFIPPPPPHTLFQFSSCMWWRHSATPHRGDWFSPSWPHSSETEQTSGPVGITYHILAVILSIYFLMCCEGRLLPSILYTENKQVPWMEELCREPPPLPK